MTTHIDMEMENNDYHDKEQHPHISSSDIKTIAQTSVLHWAIKQSKPRKETPAMRMGSAIHGMILEPHKNEFMRGLPNRVKRKEWAEMEEAAERKGKILLTEGEYDDAQFTADAALDTCEFLHNITTAPNFCAEASIFTECDRTGLDIKCRPDGWLMPQAEGEQGVLIDIKTTTAETPEAFEREIRRYDYAIQAAFYLHTMKCADFPCKAFYFAAVQKETGITTLHLLSELYLKHAEKRMFAAMDKLIHARETEEFTTGWGEVNIVHLPSWLEEEEELDETPF